MFGRKGGGGGVGGGVGGKGGGKGGGGREWWPLQQRKGGRKSTKPF